MSAFRRHLFLAVPAAALALSLASCASNERARSLDLNDPHLHRMLTANVRLTANSASDRAHYTYVNPDLPPVRYTRMLLEPVMVSKEGELDQDEVANFQVLADNAFQIFRKELAQDFEIVTAPSPGTLRVQIAILDAQPSQPVRRVMASATPVGMGMSLAKYAITGKATAVGEITVEMVLTDAQSGKLMGAALDRRVGTMGVESTVTGVINRWANADEAITAWAKHMRTRLAEVRAQRAKMLLQPAAK